MRLLPTPVMPGPRRLPRRALAAVLALLLAVTGCAAASGNEEAARSAESVTGRGTAAATPASPVPYPAIPESQRPDTRGLRLVYAEEFDGGRLDRSRWNTQLEWGRTNNVELQYYTPDALEVRDGMLAVTARHQPTGGKPWSSGAITTYDKYAFQYGYLEMRAKAVKGRGLWPAVWLLSLKRKDPNEIDILECLGRNPYRNQMSLHYGFGKLYHTLTYTGPDFSSGFHTFAVDWTPDSIVWYIDGVERFSVHDHVPSVRMYLIANLAIGGPYAGKPDVTTPSQGTFLIDYIRVYQGARHQAKGQGAGGTDQ